MMISGRMEEREGKGDEVQAERAKHVISGWGG
jgi:hypothetical protein